MGGDMRVGVGEHLRDGGAAVQADVLEGGPSVGGAAAVARAAVWAPEAPFVPAGVVAAEVARHQALHIHSACAAPPRAWAS